jgi:hypothetical protein
LSDTEASFLAIALAVCLKKKEKKKRRWMKEWLKKRNEYTQENLLKDLRLSEPSDFQNFLQLDAVSFDEMLKMITPRIEKKEYYYVRCYSSKPAFVNYTTLPCYWKYF